MSPRRPEAASSARCFACQQSSVPTCVRCEAARSWNAPWVLAPSARTSHSVVASRRLRAAAPHAASAHMRSSSVPQLSSRLARSAEYGKLRSACAGGGGTTDVKQLQQASRIPLRTPRAVSHALSRPGSSAAHNLPAVWVESLTRGVRQPHIDRHFGL
jgi:hypothetical protein